MSSQCEIHAPGEPPFPLLFFGFPSETERKTNLTKVPKKSLNATNTLSTPCLRANWGGSLEPSQPLLIPSRRLAALQRPVDGEAGDGRLRKDAEEPTDVHLAR